MTTEICVPAALERLTNGSIGRWFKRIGDPVSAGEPVVEIETDGRTVEVPASVTGVLTQILVGDGASVEAGTVLGRITQY